MLFLNDNSVRNNLFPLTHTRHTAQIRVGCFTIKQKWEILLGQEVFLSAAENRVEVPANIIPTKENFQKIIELASSKKSIASTDEIKCLKYPWHIFQLNDYAIRQDVNLINKNNFNQKISPKNKTIDTQNIFVGSNVSMEHCFLNASTGLIIIDDNATLQEGAMIRGPFYLGKNSVVKMGAKIFGATTIGDNCTIGGEVKNSVVQDYSNKAHDGYLGDSVLGSWCNLGAGTSNSNIKNTAGDVMMQLSSSSEKINAGTKAGFIMGDYSRAAINTSFNTGTVVGVCCNVFGDNNPPKYINNFTWGKEQYDFEKAITHIKNWMTLKNKNITETEIEILKKVYSQR